MILILNSTDFDNKIQSGTKIKKNPFLRCWYQVVIHMWQNKNQVGQTNLKEGLFPIYNFLLWVFYNYVWSSRLVFVALATFWNQKTLKWMAQYLLHVWLPSNLRIVSIHGYNFLWRMLSLNSHSNSNSKEIKSQKQI